MFCVCPIMFVEVLVCSFISVFCWLRFCQYKHITYELIVGNELYSELYMIFSVSILFTCLLTWVREVEYVLVLNFCLLFWNGWAVVGYRCMLGLARCGLSFGVRCSLSCFVGHDSLPSSVVWFNVGAFIRAGFKCELWLSYYSFGGRCG